MSISHISMLILTPLLQLEVALLRIRTISKVLDTPGREHLRPALNMASWMSRNQGPVLKMRETSAVLSHGHKEATCLTLGWQILTDLLQLRKKKKPQTSPTMTPAKAMISEDSSDECT